MMSLRIEQATTKKQIKQAVLFQFDLYKGNPNFVPQLINDELELFSEKNPALKKSPAKIFIAYKDNKIVGRVAAILCNPANEKWGTKNLRFSWFDCIDDFEVAKALFAEVEKWAKELGMNTITGPQGFCDLDQQGMLVEGFDQLATIASYYGMPYYPVFMERLGYAKDIDFVEFLSTPPYEEGMPEKMVKSAEWIKKRYNFRILDYKSAKEYKKRGDEIFRLLEETFSENYGTVPLSQEQKEYYIKKYISYIHTDLIKVVVTENDEMVGFMITMPNMSKAYQKANGRLLPFGIFHMLKAFKTYEVLDFYLAGVKKEYRGKGVDLLMAVEIVNSAMKLGFHHAESNQELETNTKVQAEWKFFKPVLHKRRRIFKKSI